MWELIISAVDKKLAHFYPKFNDAGSWYERRAIPLPVLQALLDGFTAVQHLPQATLIRIRTFTGISTLVVWAHHVLGLTVLVERAGISIKFGNGPESVCIDAIQIKDAHTVPPSASLVNETDELLFEVERSIEDVDLHPASRHSVEGYGLWVIEFKVHQPEAIENIVHTIITSCLRLIEDEWHAGRGGSEDSYRGGNILPAAKRVLRVAKLMFPGHEILLEKVGNQTGLPCLLRSEWERQTLPEGFKGYVERSPDAGDQSASIGTLKNLTHELAHILLILSMFENVDRYPALSIDMGVLMKECYMPFRLPSAVQALESMTELLKGRDSGREVLPDITKNAAAISSWGWCICLGSMAGDDPSRLCPSLAVLQGVPRREGERKRLIVDGTAKNVYYEQGKKIDDSFELTAGPGESVALESWTRPEKTKYYIAVTDVAFEVGKVYSTRSIADPSASRDVIIGFRAMQNAYWRMVHLPACDHPVRIGQCATLPTDTWAFRGFGKPYGPPPGIRKTQECQDGTTHVALVANDNSARWITSMEHYGVLEKKYLDRIGFLRHPDCCLQCALNFTAHFRRGRHVGLVL